LEEPGKSVEFTDGGEIHAGDDAAFAKEAASTTPGSEAGSVLIK
jgi:hypothetical protein